MGSHRPIISASAHTSRVILHHTVFNWTLRHGSILVTIYQSVLHSRYCPLISVNHLNTRDTCHKAGVWHKGCIFSKGGRSVAGRRPVTGNKNFQRANFSVSRPYKHINPGNERIWHCIVFPRTHQGSVPFYPPGTTAFCLNTIFFNMF